MAGATGVDAMSTQKRLRSKGYVGSRRRCLRWRGSSADRFASSPSVQSRPAASRQLAHSCSGRSDSSDTAGTGRCLEACWRTSGDERVARTQLDEEGVLRLTERGQGSRREAHGFAQMAGPVPGIDRLRIGESLASERRVDRRGRCLERHLAHERFERRDSAFHHRGMEGMRSLEQLRRHAGCFELLAELLDEARGAGSHASRRPVLRGERDAVGQLLREFGRGQPHRQHVALGHRLHERAALRHQPRSVTQAHHASQHCCREFADAVPDQRRRLDAQRLKLTRERVFEREGGGLRDGGRLQRGLIVREHALAQVECHRAVERLQAFVEGLAKRRFVGVERAPHAGVLRALAGEHEDRLRHPGGDLAGDLGRRVVGAQRLHGLCDRFGHHATAVRESLAADAQRVRDVCERHAGIGFEVGGEARCGGCQCGRRACRELQQLRPSAGVRRSDQRRLLDDHVGVRSADAEGTHAGAPRRRHRAARIADGR